MSAVLAAATSLPVAPALADDAATAPAAATASASASEPASSNSATAAEASAAEETAPLALATQDTSDQSSSSSSSSEATEDAWRTDADAQSAIVAKARAAKFSDADVDTLAAFMRGDAVSDDALLALDTTAIASINEDLAEEVSTVQAAVKTSHAASGSQDSAQASDDASASADEDGSSASDEEVTDESADDSSFEEGPQSNGSEPDADQVGMSESSSDDTGDVVFTFSPNPTTDEFIASIAEQARTIADENDLYASVMIAQAILESGSGSSSLSKEPNYNLFGIKGDYNGSSVTFWTAEDDGTGNYYMIQSAFRAYPSVEESLRDYAALLTSSYYTPYVLKSQTASYVDVCDYLQGRYATSTTYSAKLQAIIDAYDLTQYDQLLDESDEEEAPEEEAEEEPAEEAAAVVDDAVVSAPTSESPDAIDEGDGAESDSSSLPNPLAMVGVPAILAIALESVNLTRRVRARRGSLSRAQHANTVSGDDPTEKIAPVEASDPADPLQP